MAIFLPVLLITFLEAPGCGRGEVVFFLVHTYLRLSLCSPTFMKEDVLLDSSSLLSTGFYLLFPKALHGIKTEAQVCWLNKCPQGTSSFGALRVPTFT